MKIYPTEEHIHKLREYLRGHDLEAILTLALVTGIRRDELLHLTWSEVDLEKCEMHVWNSKTMKSARFVHLSEACVQLLWQYRQHRMEQRVERGLDWQNLYLVFPDRTGGFLEPQHLLERWYEVLEEAGLPRFCFHDLRGFVLGRMLEHGRASREGHDRVQDGSFDRDKDADEW